MDKRRALERIEQTARLQTAEWQEAVEALHLDPAYAILASGV